MPARTHTSRASTNASCGSGGTDRSLPGAHAQSTSGSTFMCSMTASPVRWPPFRAGSAVCAVALRPEASERTTMTGAILLIACSSRRAEVALERQLAYPLARRGEDRVRQRWCRNCRAWLADPAGCLNVPHQMHVDRRALIHPQHANVVEVGLLHPPVLQG